jgi:rubrerythrin
MNKLKKGEKISDNNVNKFYCCNNCGSLFTKLPKENYCPICKYYSIKPIYLMISSPINEVETI